MWIVPIVFGILILIIAFVIKYKYIKDIEKSHLIHAVVQGVNKKDMQGGHSRYYPVLEFEVNGEARCMQYCFGTKKPRYKIGQKLDIFYDESEEFFYIVGDTVENKLFIALLTISFLLFTVSFLLKIL